MAKLKRLRIERFRGVAPGTELVFNDTFNVLLGQNGTGKTTLLKLIAMALASNFEALRGEPFALEYEIESIGLNLTVSVRNELPEQAVPEPRFAHDARMTRHAEGASQTWSYDARVRFHQHLPEHHVSVNPMRAVCFVAGTLKDEMAVPVYDPFQPGFLGSAVAKVFDIAADKFGSQWLLDVWGDALSNGGRGRFDEASRAFEQMIQESPRQDSDDCIDSPTLLVAKRNDAQVTVLQATRIPPAVIRLVKSNPTWLDSKSPTIPHTELPFLGEAVALFQCSGADLVLRLSSKRVTNLGEELLYGGLAFTFTLEDGSVITHNALSYGQKRLLSFFHYLAVSEDIVIADELVNGLHYDWIEACLRRLVDRQSFLTSQNPLLLDFLPFTSADDVRRSFILCRRELHEGRPRTAWANMDEDMAAAFFRAYRTEALQVSEILRTKGLW
ncbi:AAA family ATPase [Sorangium sp. So ce1182]|uniref:AAA family ATPase n=1 Tax=Sorangium sp. So ce1182 TaxID=3133334 RepID=UPI003F61F42D